MEYTSEQINEMVERDRDSEVARLQPESEKEQGERTGDCSFDDPTIAGETFERVEFHLRAHKIFQKYLQEV